MKSILATVILFITFIGITISIINIIPVPEYRVYDCGMSEFHPDFPKEVREECRKIRASSITRT